MPMPDVKCVLIHDNFQNFKSYNIPKAQLVIADIPYNIGTDFYASRPRCKFDECAEFFDAYNITFKNHSCLEVCYDGSDHLSCLWKSGENPFKNTDKYRQ